MVAGHKPNHANHKSRHEESGVLERTDKVGSWAWKHNNEKETKRIEMSDEVHYGIRSC